MDTDLLADPASGPPAIAGAPTGGPPTAGRAATVRRACGSGAVRRIGVVYLAFRTVELGSWVAVTIHAHHRGGVDEAGAVMVAELVPAVVVAALVGQAAARWGTRRVLRAGLTALVGGLGVVGAAVAGDGPWWVVYGAAVVASTAMVTVRPTLLASLPRSLTPVELTAVHSLLGWSDGLALLAGPAVVAVALALGGSASPFAVMTALAVLALAVSRGIGPPAAADDRDRGSVVDVEPERSAGFGAATRAVVAAPGAGAALSVLAAQALLVGALDLLAVVAAVDVLGGAPSLAGWLSAAFGVGAVLGGAASLWASGRERLWPVVAAAGGLAVASSAVVGASEALLVSVPAFAGCGLAVTVLLVTSRSILQRVAPPAHVCHAFALAESAEMAMLLVGVAVVPLLARVLDGTHGAIAVGAVLAVALVVATPRLVVAERVTAP